MTAHFVPRVRCTPQNTQYTYHLNRRVYDVKTYPVLSPQGATILIYGHDHGFTVVWRGGRRLKAPKKEAPPEPQQGGRDKRNGGGGDDAVMIIDSDDDAPPPAAAPAKPFVDKPEFEEPRPGENRADASFPEVVQTLDLALGASVRHIAVLPMPHCAADDDVAAWGSVEMLREKMVFAVTCLTAEVYVVSLPLTPPSHESKARPELAADLLAGNAGRGLWGETLVSLGGQVQHSNAVAITLAKQQQPQPQKASGRGSKSAEKSGSQSVARVIVAAHSKQATGVLRLWDVTIGHQKRGAAERPLEPFQADFLPNPLTCLSFNPTHTTQLLAVASPHAVRVYDYSLPSVPQDEDSNSPFPSQGSWLLSLYSPFIRTSGAGISTARKPVVGAGWVVHGRAIIALLADGQWGIWDVDGAGPSLSSDSSGGLFSKATSGVRGAALTTFTTAGYIDGFSPLRNPGSQRPTGDLNPMTPHTRRDVSSSIAGGPERLAAISGGLEVVQLGTSPAPSGRGSGGDDESVVLWLCGVDHAVAVVPVLGRFWEAQVRRGSGGGGSNPFSGAQPARMIRLTDLSAGLLGERCGGVTAVPRRTGRPHHDASGAHAAGLPIDVLVRGESRLVVVREADDAVPVSSVSAKILNARKRVLGPIAAEDVAPPAAIVVHPRPGTSATMPAAAAAALAQSIRGKRGGASLRGSLFGRPADDEDVAAGGAGRSKFARPPLSTSLFLGDGPTFTQSMLAIRPGTSGGDAAATDLGFGFAGQLREAADATDDEEAANERNVEEEILDIMEIDRALEGMEDARQSASKHVFFENASKNVFSENS